MSESPATLWLSPHGRLYIAPADGAPVLDVALLEPLQAEFAIGTGHGLLHLAAVAPSRPMPPAWAFWRSWGIRFLTGVCALTGQEMDLPSVPDLDARETFLHGAPALPGGEYLTPEVLEALWIALGKALAEARSGFPGSSLQDYLQSLDPVWNVVGRVHFNLAENRKDEQSPFAFLATYTHAVSTHGKAQHLPLGQALQEYAGAARRDQLLSLLLPVQRASERCPWLKQMVDAGEIFHPLRWAPTEAFRFLGDAPELEKAGVVVRMPAQWKAGRPGRPRVGATVGGKPPKGLGQKALMDFQVELALDGEPLTAEEARALLASGTGLAFLRGQWVEVDHARLSRTLARFQEAEQLARKGGLTFAEAMRLLAGAGDAEGFDAEEEEVSWSRVTAGPWLAEILKGLRSPESLAALEVGPGLRGTLRPYQQAGLRWLHLLSELGLGACLADDMGLGKTIQVLSLLLLQQGRKAGPSLLVAPASLLGNWVSELERFTPGLRPFVAHASEWKHTDRTAAPDLEGVDLVITSYGSLLRMPWVLQKTWNLAILDEAQAIKNAATRQTRTVKQIQARSRIAMTGTPVENRLGDLWSIFDFINPGLLGTAKAFTSYTKALASREGASYAPLRDLVRPYILRRLKTDKAIVPDLPDKTELKAYCPLSRRQAALYAEGVKDMAEQLERAEDGIQRRGLVLSFLMRFKQICNHPSQWLGDGAWGEDQSGKFARLRELCETIAARQEKLLVFTQFRETTEPLAGFLGSVFGRPGLVLHGQTEVKRRKELVKRFQEDETVPFFVLSIKAGGSGLNLTAASHVIHFDRWWNPAVENQATDRAFRIGQTRNVLVHKFICRGTVEEKIDALIESKQHLTRDLLDGGAELNLTELSDDEILKLVSLDLDAALED